MSIRSGVRRAQWHGAWRGALLMGLVLLATGCVSRGEHPVAAAADVLSRHAAELMSIPGVVGVYEGLSRRDTVIRVMLASGADSTRQRIPRRLEGYRVETEVSGPIEPMRR